MPSNEDLIFLPSTFYSTWPLPFLCELISRSASLFSVTNFLPARKRLVSEEIAMNATPESLSRILTASEQTHFGISTSHLFNSLPHTNMPPFFPLTSHNIPESALYFDVSVVRSLVHCQVVLFFPPITKCVFLSGLAVYRIRVPFLASFRRYSSFGRHCFPSDRPHSLPCPSYSQPLLLRQTSHSVLSILRASFLQPWL